MRIVIFGLSLTSSWGNGHATTYRSLVKGLALCGHDVTFLERDVPWYAENRDLWEFDYCTLGLYDSLDELARDHGRTIADADVVMVGSYVPEGIRLLDWLRQRRHDSLCFYDIDTPVTLEALEHGTCEYLRPDQIGGFDIYFSFAGGAALSRLAELGARRPRALYCSVDTKLYHPPDPAQQAPAAGGWELGYMGTYAADRQPVVERLLLEVARRRPEQRFVIAGPGYPDADAWPANVEWLPHVAPAEHGAFYGRQRFTLNATRAAMVALGCSPSVRLFEAAACATCIVSDRWPGLEEVLEPGEEVLVADSTEELLALLEAVSPQRAAAIGRAARARVVREHSHLQRAEYLVGCLREPVEMRRVAT
ncbi:MAG: CgeB family protein [Pseudomonadales bacterium]